MNGLREEPKLLFITNWFLTPRIPIAVHLVSEPNKNAGDARAFEGSAQFSDTNTIVFNDGFQSVPRFNCEHGDGVNAPDFFEEFSDRDDIRVRRGKGEIAIVNGGRDAQALPQIIDAVAGL